MAQFTVTGDVDPFLHISLKSGEKIYCETNAMVMMESTLDLKGKMSGGIGGALMRRLANDESFFQQHIEAVRGDGDCLLSPTLPGAIQILEVGQTNYMISNGALVAAEYGVNLNVRTQGIGNALFGQTGGFFICETSGRGKLAVSGFMLSPMHPENSWQAQANAGFSYKSFFIDWSAQVVQCPHGKSSVVWSEAQNEAQMPVIHIRFATNDCQDCPLKADCTKGKARSLKLYAREWHEALEQARTEEKTEAFKEKYRIRAGIEGTISTAVRAYDLRHSPFIGLQKTSLHAILVASALNIIRAFNWLNEIPLTTTRKSPLAKMLA